MIPIPEHGGEHALSQTDGRIAWEIAAEIADVPTILTRYGISAEGFKRKLKDPMFRMAVREAKALWKSDLNVKERIRIKAAMLVEDSLLDVFAIIKNENMPAASKLEAFEKLMKTADLAPKTGVQPATAAGFKVVIQMGATAQEVQIHGHVVEQAAQAALSAEPVA